MTSIIPGLVVLFVLVIVQGMIFHFPPLSEAAHNPWKIYDDNTLQPIVTQSRRTRICYDLCISGLGGTPCGDSCFDLIPSNLPVINFNQQQKQQNGKKHHQDVSIININNNSSKSPSLSGTVVVVDGAGVVFNGGNDGVKIGNGTARIRKKYNATTRGDSCNVLCKNQLGYPLCACKKYDGSKTHFPDFLEICSVFCVNYGYQLYGCQNCSLYTEYLAQKNINSVFNPANLSLFNNDDNDDDSSVTVEWDLWCRNVCFDGNGGAACNCDLLP